MYWNHQQCSLLFVLLMLGSAGCATESKSESPQRSSRPVSFLVLREVDPSQLSRVTGTVESWKKELLGFRVAGRVQRVLEPGVDIDGRVFDDDGKVMTPGTVLAALDDVQYKLALEEKQASVKTIEASGLSVQAELNESIPQQLKEAQATLDFQKQENERITKLFEQGAATRSEFDQMRASFRSAEAQVDRIGGERSAKAAELTAWQARAYEARQTVNRATVDLDDCKLYSPFRGQISKVHVIPGGYVDPGQPVVTVQMMDPMKVEIAVSPETDRRLNYNDVLPVYMNKSDEPLEGWVYLKDTVADAATRTFMVTLLVRNHKVDIHRPENADDESLVRTDGLLKLEPEHANGKPPYIIEREAIHYDDEGAFVWLVEDIKVTDLLRGFNPVFQVHKVRIDADERIVPFLQVFTFQVLKDIGELDPVNDLVTGKLPDTVKDGDRVYFARRRWLFRPGDLVQVDLQGGAAKPGLYVPSKAVIKEGEKHYVFTVEESKNGAEEAHRVEVKTGKTVGDFRLIEPTDKGHLENGVKLIVEGAHYLRDGDPVNAFDEVELSL